MLLDGLNWLCYFAGSSKSHRENSISFTFLESPHQVDMKNVVKSSKHFFGYFNTLETHTKCAQFPGGLFSSRDKRKKLSQLRLFNFPFGMRTYIYQAKYHIGSLWLQELHFFKGPDFKLKLIFFDQKGGPMKTHLNLLLSGCSHKYQT